MPTKLSIQEALDTHQYELQERPAINQFLTHMYVCAKCGRGLWLNPLIKALVEEAQTFTVVTDDQLRRIYIEARESDSPWYKPCES